jgi:acyl carrier protein
MAIAELTMRLCETFQVEIPLHLVSRERFESLDSIFEHYVRGKAATR